MLPALFFAGGRFQTSMALHRTLQQEARQEAGKSGLTDDIDEYSYLHILSRASANASYVRRNATMDSNQSGVRRCNRTSLWVHLPDEWRVGGLSFVVPAIEGAPLRDVLQDIVPLPLWRLHDYGCHWLLNGKLVDDVGQVFVRSGLVLRLCCAPLRGAGKRGTEKSARDKVLTNAVAFGLHPFPVVSLWFSCLPRGVLLVFMPAPWCPFGFPASSVASFRYSCLPRGFLLVFSPLVQLLLLLPLPLP